AANMFRKACQKPLCRKDFGGHVRLPARGAVCSRTSTWALARLSATHSESFSDNLGWTGLVPSAKCPFSLHAPVAQLDRASGFDPAGPPFESGRGHSESPRHRPGSPPPPNRPLVGASPGAVLGGPFGRSGSGFSPC